MKTKPTYQELENQIAELKKQNEKLRSDISFRDKEQISEAYLYTRSLIEASLDPLIIINLAGKITDVNIASEKITGLPRDILIGTDFSNYFTEPENARIGYQKVFGQNYLSDYPLTIRSTTNKLTDVLCNASVYLDNEGKVIGIFAAARDITELKQAEHALKQKTNELEQQSLFINALLDNLKVGVVACDTDGKLTYFNKTTQMFHGLPQVEISADKWAEHYDLYLPDGKTKMQTKDIPLFKALEGEQFNDIEMMIIQKQGKSYVLAASGNTILDADGKKQGAVVSMYDITERKQAEQALKESNTTKDKFFSIIAHDLKNPFNSMLGFSEILNEKFDEYNTEKQKEFIGVINSNIQITYKLLENLLLWSCSQRGNN